MLVRGHVYLLYKWTNGLSGQVNKYASMEMCKPANANANLVYQISLQSLA